MSDVIFLSPAWLWLLLGTPLFFVNLRRSAPRLHPLWRAFAVACLVLGLARPGLWTADEHARVVYVMDGSASVAPDELRSAVAAIDDAVERAPSSVDPSIVMVHARVFRSSRARVRGIVERSGDSPLGAALSAGLRSIPDGSKGSLVFVTDGLATDRRFGDAIAEAQERGIPVHVTPLRAPRPEPSTVAISTSDTLRVGHESRIYVDVAADGADATVTLAGPGGDVGRQSGRVEGRRRFEFAFEPRQAGFATMTATQGPRGIDRPYTRTFAVQPALRALYLGGRMVGGRDRLAQLVGRGIDFESLPAQEGAALPDFSRYDLVVLDDAPKPTDPITQAITRAVREDGLGLFACGGEAAFGPGGWHETPLADVLPVTARQKEEKRDPSSALVVIIDTSGSMGGERIQLAKETARLAINRLLPHDKVGIVEFYGTKHWAAPLQPASNAIDIQRALNRLDAGGGTVILPAIEEAFYGLQNVQARYKHVLVLTDGGVENGAFEPLLRHMADDGITTSTVLIGPEAHSEFLVNLANWGKGRFYAVPDRFNLPEILLKQPKSSRLPAYKPGTFAVSTRGGAGWWGEVDRTTIPPLAGFVETQLRPGAEVLAEVRGSREPILSTWNVGLGRVTAFTSEPVGRGTEPWNEWAGFGPWLARVLTRTADDGRRPFSAELVRDGDAVTLTVRRRRPGNERPRAVRVDASVADPAAALPLQVRSPDVFQCTFACESTHDVRVAVSVDGATADPVAFAASDHQSDVAAESEVDPADAIDLPAVARATGGDVITLDALAAANPRSGGDGRPSRLLDLTPFCFLLALATYVFEIFHRRRDRRA